MLAEDEIRLAWRAHIEGRIGTRDSLLTLAVVDAAPEDRVWAEPCRRWLVRNRPDHLFAGFSNRENALADPSVAACIGRIRHTFPPDRVRHLVLRSEALRGPLRRRRPSTIDLLGLILGGDAPFDPPKARSSRPRTASQPMPSRRSNPGRRLAPVRAESAGEPVSLDRAMLLGMAVLLALALQDRGEETRAA